MPLRLTPSWRPSPDRAEYVNSSGKLDSEGYNKAYDAWQKDRSAQSNQPEGYAEALEGYLRRSIPQLLSDVSGKTLICSPLNVYMALAMLAETTDGDSRAQLLELLARDSEQVYLSELRHAARVATNEEGITATAYTISFPVAADIEETPPAVDFVLDRPSIFAITSHDGLPLFCGGRESALSLFKPPV